MVVLPSIASLQFLTIYGSIFHVWGEKIHIISKGEGNVDYNTIKKRGGSCT